MTRRVLIIGGYGNFGRLISKILAPESNIQLIISGRHESKAKEFAKQLGARNKPEIANFDIHQDLQQALFQIKPDIVVHTSGPYQKQSYTVAQSCISYGCHYIDLADARDFVSGITTLNKAAKQKGVLVCSGASSVPCLSGAIVDKYEKQFDRLETLEYAITTAQSTNLGLATATAALSYAGKPFRTLIDGKKKEVYGWLNLRRHKFWRLNDRLLGNCDIPDLEIFPSRYPDLKTIRFQAGLELKPLQIILWTLAGLSRFRLCPALQPLAPFLLKTSSLFAPLSKGDSGFYMKLGGLDKTGHPKEATFHLVARHGDGLYIPAIPAALIVKKLACGHIQKTGAQPCIGLITLEEYLQGLNNFNIQWQYQP